MPFSCLPAIFLPPSCLPHATILPPSYLPPASLLPYSCFPLAFLLPPSHFLPLSSLLPYASINSQQYLISLPPSLQATVTGNPVEIKFSLYSTGEDCQSFSFLRHLLPVSTFIRDTEIRTRNSRTVQPLTSGPCFFYCKPGFSTQADVRTSI